MILSAKRVKKIRKRSFKFESNKHTMVVALRGAENALVVVGEFDQIYPIPLTQIRIDLSKGNFRMEKRGLKLTLLFPSRTKRPSGHHNPRQGTCHRAKCPKS